MNVKLTAVEGGTQIYVHGYARDLGRVFSATAIHDSRVDPGGLEAAVVAQMSVVQAAVNAARLAKYSQVQEDSNGK